MITGASRNVFTSRLTWLILFCSILIACVRFFPLNWFAGMVVNPYAPYPLTYQGTVWKGAVSGIPNIAPVRLDAFPAKALSGEAALSFRSQSSRLQFAGRIGLKQLEDFALRGHASYLGVVDNRLGNLSGLFTLNITEAHFNAACESATGSASVDILARNAHLWYWQGPLLSGPVTCEDGALYVALSGEDNSTDVRAQLAIRLDGTYRIQIDLTSTDPRTDAILPVYGFQKTQNGYRLSEAGKWT